MNTKSIKLERVGRVAKTGQYHGCYTCGRLTWHERSRRNGVTVMRCTECGRTNNGTNQ